LIIKPLPPHSVPSFPDTIVMPGDILVADLDGVVVIPKGKVGEVVELAERGKAVDERIAKDLKAGRGVAESFAKWR
jgi:regulator of RNase E activity RraA